MPSVLAPVRAAYLPAPPRLFLPSQRGAALPSLVIREREPESRITRVEDMPVRHAFKSSCLLFIGRRGSGKSAAMNYHLKLRRSRFEKLRYRFEWKTLTNYYCKFADIADPFLVDRLVDFDADLQNGDIGLDEIHNFALARRAMAKQNINFGAEFITQMRKRKLNLDMTTQFPQVLDYMVLLQIDFFIRCQKFGDRIRLNIFDYWGLVTGNDSRKRWPPEPGTEDFVRWIPNIHAIFGDYDTEEVIPSIYNKNRDAMIERAWGFKETPAMAEKVDAAVLAPPAPADTAPLAPAEELKRKSAAFLNIVFMRQVNGVFEVQPLVAQAEMFLGDVIPKGHPKALQMTAEWLIAQGYEIFRDGKTLKGRKQR